MELLVYEFYIEGITRIASKKKNINEIKCWVFLIVFEDKHVAFQKKNFERVNYFHMLLASEELGSKLPTDMHNNLMLLLSHNRATVVAFVVWNTHTHTHSKYI